MEDRSYTPAITGVCVCDNLLYCGMLGDKVFMSQAQKHDSANAYCVNEREEGSNYYCALTAYMTLCRVRHLL